MCGLQHDVVYRLYERQISDQWREQMKKIKLAVFDMEGTLFKRSYCFGFIKERFPEYWLKLCICAAEETLRTEPFSYAWSLLGDLWGPETSNKNQANWQKWRDGAYPDYDSIKKQFPQNWENLCLRIGEKTLETRKFSSAWTLLCDLLGPVASKINQDNWKRWSDRGYPGYSEWVIDTIKIHKEYGLPKALFDAVVNESAKYFSGVAETFQALQSQGITIALVSGGLKAMADRVALDFGLEHCFSSAEYFWNSDGTIRHWNCQPSDFIHKKRLVKLLLHDLGISKEQAVFIGDGGNDREVAQYVGFSIGFNTKPYHEFFWDTYVKQEDLRAVLGPLGISPIASKSNSGLSRTDSPASDRVTKSAFRKFLLEHGGLTDNSSRSYITYLNSILLNMQGIAKAGASSSRTPLQLLLESAKVAKSEASFIKALSKPLTGPEGRIGDLASTAKQFYRFTQLIT
jgi:phosphoserine phosphatase